ncbi:MAG: helix-turn-helix transcriptional regulator [Clostridiaceae bacterium]|nr:helix-turn-helix transcriptional regulator [Clostridiaceae bacterium]
MESQMKTVEILINDISPRVLKTSLFTAGMDMQEGYKFRKREVYDYEIEFFLSSEGFMLIDETIYPIKKGDIVFRRPGQITQAIMPFSCYVIFVDLLGNTGKDSENYDFEKEQKFQNNYTNEMLNLIPPVVHTSFNDRYHYLFDAVLKEFINSNEVSSVLLKALILQILHQLYIDIKNPFTNGFIPISSHYFMLKKVVEYIQNNIGDDLSLKRLAEFSGLSPNYLHMLFTKTMNIPINEYITILRLEKAKGCLVTTDSSVSEIALECGFENIPYFSYVFKRRVNVSPSQFRKKYRYL